MSWAQLTNRPNNGSHQGYYNNNNNNGNNDNWNRNNNSNNNRKVGLRTINNGNYSNSYRSNNKRNNNRNQYNRNNKHHNNNNSYNNNYHNNNNQPPRRSVGLTGNKKRHNDINYVILDSGAFIGRQNFFNNFTQDTVYYMTPAVQNEIRDKGSRQFLESFPYHINIKDPDPQSITFVNKFISKNPNLRSLSKVDKGVIALAHTLEQEYSGQGGGGGGIRPQGFNKRQQPQKAMTVMQGHGRNKHEEKSKDSPRKTIKKSKTGRIHTDLKPLNDTGVRLAMLKKVVPFQFDDFMTLSQQKYGEKYGKPTSQDIQAMGHQGSPVRSPLKARIMNEAKEKDDDTKEMNKGTTTNENDAEKKTGDKQDESKENKYKYKPNIKAMTEAPVQDIAPSSQSPLSKAQRRRRRKRAANAAKQDKIAETSGLTEENILKFQKIEEEESDEDGDIMKELKLSELKQLKEDMQRQKELEDEIKSNAESVKSELDKMIEEDEAGLFNETAVLMNSLSEKSVKLKLTPNPDMPSLSQSQSLPTTATAETIAFGTMFPTATIADIATAGDTTLTSPRSPMEAFNSPLPPLAQNQTSDTMPYATPAAKPNNNINQNVSPNPLPPNINPNASVSPQPVIESNKSLPLPQPIRPSPNNQQSQPSKKMTVNDAWDGGWLGPENYKPVPKNQNKKKSKVKNVPNATNKDSSVAVITVDQTLQRAMVDMGLRVMSTSADRQYGNNNNNQGTNRRNNNRNAANGGEPVDYQFRCYGCFHNEHDTTRTHCRWCGGQTFQRVAIYQDDNGKHHHRYYYRDRYAQKYMEKHSLVPRGAQLVKYNQTNGRNNVQGNNNQQQRKNQKKKNKKRGYLSQNNNNFRGGGSRW